MDRETIESVFSGVYSIMQAPHADKAIAELLPGAGNDAGGPVGLILDQSGFFRRAEGDDRREDGRHISWAEVADVFHRRFGEPLTPAETNLLMSLLCGESLTEMSARDGVSYGTRRNQLSAIREKAGISRQADLVMIMSVLLANSVQGNDIEMRMRRSPLEAVMGDFYRPDFRLHVPKLESGRLLLVADIGPLDGRPCLFMHASFFPLVPLPGHADILKRLNIRVLTPMRPGYYHAPISSDDPLTATEHFAEDVANLVKVFNLRGAPIVSHTFGVVAGLMLSARRSDDHRVLLSSPQFFAKGSHEKVNSFRIGWARLANRYPTLVEPVLDVFAKRFLAVDKFMGAIEKAYESSPADQKHIAAASGHPWYGELLRQTALTNAVGLRNDMVCIGRDWVPLLEPARGDVSVLYGETDPYANFTLVTDRLTEQTVPFEIMPEMGQNSAIHNPELLFARAFAQPQSET